MRPRRDGQHNDGNVDANTDNAAAACLSSCKGHIGNEKGNNMEHAPATKTSATPLYVPDPPDPRTSKTTTETCQPPGTAHGRAQPKISRTKLV
eukprot:6185150-Pleurochrysis_carterae.AAC.3